MRILRQAQDERFYWPLVVVEPFWLDVSLGNEQQLAGGGPALQLPVRFRSIGQREFAADPELQFTGGDPAQNVAGPFFQFGPVHRVVTQTGAGQ